MAIQTGVLPLRRQAGGVSFYKMKGINYARQKTNIPKERIATDPAFENTRKNNAEFGRAADVSKILRDTFSPAVGWNSDSYVSGRLTALALLGVQADVTNPWGIRNFVDGDPAIVVGFQFNEQAPMDTVFHAPYTLVINRTPGTVVMTIPIFNANTEVNPAPGATHFRVIMEGAEINWGTGETNIDTEVGAWIPVTQSATTLQTLTVNLTAASTDPIYAVVAVEFAKLVSATYNILRNSAYDAAFIAGGDV